jgi:hypothetical protein
VPWGLGLGGKGRGRVMVKTLGKVCRGNVAREWRAGGCRGQAKVVREFAMLPRLNLSQRLGVVRGRGEGVPYV